MGEFFKRAFQDMKESAKEQHKVDKANFEAFKAESKAQWEEAKSMRSPDKRKAAMRAEREEQLSYAKERIAAAQERINNIKK